MTDQELKDLIAELSKSTAKLRVFQQIYDGAFELLTRRGFKPKAFGPAAKQDGTVKKRQPQKK